MAFTLGKHLGFIDSLQFISSSLYKLAENITKCGKCETCQPGKCVNPSFTKGGSSSHPKGLPSITFEQNNLETSNFA